MWNLRFYRATQLRLDVAQLHQRIHDFDAVPPQLLGLGGAPVGPRDRQLVIEPLHLRLRATRSAPTCRRARRPGARASPRAAPRGPASARAGRPATPPRAPPAAATTRSRAPERRPNAAWQTGRARPPTRPRQRAPRGSIGCGAAAPAARRAWIAGQASTPLSGAGGKACSRSRRLRNSSLRACMMQSLHRVRAAPAAARGRGRAATSTGWRCRRAARRSRRACIPRRRAARRPRAPYRRAAPGRARDRARAAGPSRSPAADPAPRSSSVRASTQRRPRCHGERRCIRHLRTVMARTQPANEPRPSNWRRLCSTSTNTSCASSSATADARHQPPREGAHRSLEGTVDGFLCVDRACTGAGHRVGRQVAVEKGAHSRH